MPLSSLKIFKDTGEEFLPENVPLIAKEIAPEFEGFDFDPSPSDDGPGIHEPIAAPPRRGRPPIPPLVPPVTKQQEREVRDELDAIVKLAALAWSVPDPECGGVLNEQSAAISASLVNLLKRNPRLLASLRGAGWLGDWVALVMALTPVCRAIYSHHLAPKEFEQSEDYPDGFDPTAPRTNYAAYLRRPNGVGNSQVA